MSDAAVAASVAPTLRAVHAADGGPWAQATIAQLVALVEHVAARAPRPPSGLGDVLTELGAGPLVPASGTPDERAAAALVACVGRDDEKARRVRTALRAVLVAELDAELTTTMPLLDAFRGRMPGG